MTEREKIIQVIRDRISRIDNRNVAFVATCTEDAVRGAKEVLGELLSDIAALPPETTPMIRWCIFRNDEPLELSLNEPQNNEYHYLKRPLTSDKITYKLVEIRGIEERP